ncbi:glucose-1-phosphate thymidylyltransferase RfbA [Candidatus Deianiraea vastatrix]|uniref:Glucose-1-phosphate thymidylyltransferase n=1 Tax=Candidatus Deianiraea vastatrix TaxID=2163644 RepID=A0A5B8XH63_9RICK|nr:glucose-1-phosphate thymidylyltransferase RfbA [Candidatus Deianiraea vastatrix]QED23461.1 Glucose-1-phosphate thymidylyltransferase 2 [Candidatus Deianiraea vastatrix]
MKGIILAGGSGTRLAPMTKAFSKHLLPVYDKPMLYYPLSILMLLGIREIHMIATSHDKPLYEELFGDGSHLGISIQYVIQDKPNGIAEAFLLTYDDLKGSKVCMMLGDNIFYIPNHKEFFADIVKMQSGAYIFGYQVSDPERYGVVEVDGNGKALSIEEKPLNPKSNIAVPGMYFYDEKVFEYAKNLKPSDRGELEITDINNIYLSNKELNVKVLGRSSIWLDSGTSDALLESSHLIQSIEKRHATKIACLEEIAVNMGFVDKKTMKKWVESTKSKSSYMQYLKNLASNW